MQGFETIINSIIKLGIAMLVGFVCIKTGYITKEQNNGLSKVIVRVTLPILIITSLTLPPSIPVITAAAVAVGAKTQIRPPCATTGSNHTNPP